VSGAAADDDRRRERACAMRLALARCAAPLLIHSLFLTDALSYEHAFTTPSTPPSPPLSLKTRLRPGGCADTHFSIARCFVASFFSGFAPVWTV
jgi:hypothetical protein